MRPSSRRWLGLLAVLGLVVAAFALPAGAQTAPPPPIIDTLSPRCRDQGPNQGANVVVSGRTSTGSVQIELYSPSQKLVGGPKTVAASGGAYSGSILISPTEVGDYEVRVTNSGGRASGFIEVPCQAPSLEYSPTCFTPGVQTRVRLTARHFDRFGTGYITYDLNGSETQSKIRIPADGHGVFFADFAVTPSERPHPSEATDANRTLVANATWSACPPGVPPTTTSSTSTSTTSTSTPGTTQPTTTSPPDTTPDEPATTTSLKSTGTTTTIRPSDPPGPPVTLPPTLDLPPVTAGATLSVTPEVGPAGFVTGVTGSGFPPGPVELRWEPGLGRSIAVAGADGTFITRVLVFPNDRLGARALVAVGGPTTAIDAFLVVPSTVKPSGSNVQQINRIRRFNSR